MKIKQKQMTKRIIIASLFLLVGSFLQLIPLSQNAAALTEEQWQECRDKYQSLTLGNGAAEEQQQAWDDFTASDCYVDQGGNCSFIAVGEGSFVYQKADCPISDKYIKEKEASDAAHSRCGGVQTSIIECDANNGGGLKDNGVWALLLIAINILTAGIGIAAVGGVVYGSILYTSAGDNEAQVKQAKEIIRNVVIGVIAYIAMYALLQFIIPGGIFS
jgi:hypothetical protein